MIDLTIVAPATPLIAIDLAFDLLSSTMLGEASGRDDVGFLRSKRFKVTTNPPQQVVVDGEVIGTTPVEIECIPNSLTVYAPQMEGVQPLEKLEGLPNLTILQRRGYANEMKT
jgi:diacylglycerol kinase family enzyme